MRNNRASFHLASIHLTYRIRGFREHVYSDGKTRAQDNPCPNKINALSDRTVMWENNVSFLSSSTKKWPRCRAGP